MSDKVVDINSKRNENIIKFCPEVLSNDSYIKLSCINALDKSGYPVSPEGVKMFQKDMNIDDTGIVDIETFTLLIQVFDNDTIQDILHHIDKQINSYKEENIEEKEAIKSKKHTTKGQVKACIWLFATVFFIIYGMIAFCNNIIGLFR